MKRAYRFAAILTICLAFAHSALAETRHAHPPWWMNGLTYYATFDDPASPLKLVKGASALTLTRATTATYVHPVTGLVTAAAAGQLRIESKGALIEIARTNLFARSEQFDNATIWTQNASRVVADSAVAPDGATSAEKFIADGTNDYHRITYSLTVTDTNSMVVSTYAKKSGAESRYLIILQYDNVVHVSRYDLQLGTVTACAAGFTCGISASANGYYRAWSINPANAGTSLTGALMLSPNDTYGSYVGDNTAGGWLWGAQAEVGAFITSYIPSTSAATARNADRLSLAKANNISDTAGTYAFTFDFNGALQYERLIGNSTDSGSGQVYIQPFGPTIIANDDAARTLNVVTGGNTTNKIANAWSGVIIKGVTNGGSIVSDTFDGNMGFDTNLILGSGTASGREICGHIKSLRIWNRALSNTEMQAITK